MNKPAPPTSVSFTLNGAGAMAHPQVGERLSQTLREGMAQRDVKIGCNAGDCGACTVLVDGAPVCACLMATQQASGRTVETLAGLVTQDPIAQRLSDSFQAHAAAQCGICTPGMMVTSVGLLREHPQPSKLQIEEALGGVLCRCTGYRKIIDAVHAAGLGQTTETPTTSAVGDPIPKLDGLVKTTGRDIFSDDIAPPDALVLRVVRSPYPRASFQLGDIVGFVAKTRGLEAVISASDIPGLNAFGVIPGFIDQPVFAEEEARFRGEAVAGVIGTAEAMRAFDMGTFPIDWQELPGAQSVADALHEDAALLHDTRKGNIMCGGFVQCGEADAALERADVTATGQFTTGFVEHAYIEPEAAYAVPENGGITIHTGTQAPIMNRDSMALILGWDEARIRIAPTAVGGGFGSKLDISVQPLVALAAIKVGKPVRLTYSRSESMQSTTKRHPADITLTVGATRDGRLSGFQFLGHFNTGAYASWGPTVANRVPVHASGPYQISDYRAESVAVHTNNPPAGAFRGFGVPQSAIAQEVLFDELADALNMDALEFRILNALEAGTPTVCGQVFDQGVGIKACLEALRTSWTSERAAAEAFNNARSTEGSALRRGVGVAGGWYGCGNTSLPNPSTIKAGLRPDGQVVLHQGAMDIGQGANTVISQIFAQALGISVHDLVLLGPDTAITPDGGKTSASRQTFVSGNAAKLSGQSMRAQILQMVNASEDAILAFSDGQISVSDAGQTHRIDLGKLSTTADGYVLTSCETYDPPTKPLDANGQGIPYAQFGYAAHLVVVEVDTVLGTVNVQNFVAAHDVGQAINPLLVEAQVQGGIAQGLGMALMEEYIPGRTENLHDYLIPTTGDIPPIETIIIQDPDAHGPHGAKGLGEHVLIPTSPAILNAIHHACGARIRQVPATPSVVMAALKGAP
ncbi:MAG: molybdopterin-dependent oxidoreductase [Roseovarius sp.]|nr:molybdopterin-dependent oxidoreductase [Roseovarius sp.]